MERSPSRTGSILLALVLAASASAVALGFWRAWTIDAAPGRPAQTVPQWPASCPLPRHPQHATLIMAVHPNCPCSRASLSELAVLMTRCAGKLDAYVLFVRPPGFTQDWATTDLWRAAELTGVTRVADERLLAIHAFGAQTSGQVLVYDAEGNLRFSGGITASRGHAGESDGRDAIETLVRTGAASLDHTPVYGCALN